MNPPLPVISGLKAIKLFKLVGYEESRQKGSHVRMKKKGSTSLTIPLHKELDVGLLRSLIRDSGMTVQDFVDLLNR